MGKKRGGRRLAADDIDENGSYASSATAYSNMDQELVDAEAETFSACIDDTYESRGTTREKAWERLIGMLRSSVRADDCCQNATTITSRSQSSLHKGGATECALAATALGLHLLTIGNQDESTFQEVWPHLYKLAKAGKSPVAKVAGVEALAVVCFCCSEDTVSTHEVMGQLQGLWKQGESSKVRAAAMRAWSFLYTSLRHSPSSATLEPLLPTLSSQLHDPDVEVRAAAGEALALIYHTTSLAEENSSEEDEEEEEVESMSVVSSGSLAGLEDVVDRMKELATNKGEKLRRSKRDKAAMKSVFRELHGTLQNGRVAATKIKLRHGDLLMVDTLPSTITLNYLRRYLGGGFQVHLQFNPLLHAVFDFQPLEERPDRLSAMEKRAFRSPCSAQSKARTQDRRSQRANKGAVGGW